MIVCKTKKQLTGIRRSCQLAAETLVYLAPHVVPGITTAGINDLAEEFMRSRGSRPAPLGYKRRPEETGYPAATCVSVNEVICHGIPGPYVLKEGDVVNVDVTTILDGYYGDTSTMFAVGNVSPAAADLLRVTRECLEIGIAQVRPGAYFGNIGYNIHRHAATNGYSVVYQFGGHGTGLRFHEEPSIPFIAPRDSGPRMRKGMTFTIEPMLNQGRPEAILLEDGWTAVTTGGLSAQYEHTVAVTQTGVEILTRGPQ